MSTATTTHLDRLHVIDRCRGELARLVALWRRRGLDLRAERKLLEGGARAAHDQQYEEERQRRAAIDRQVEEERAQQQATELAGGIVAFARWAAECAVETPLDESWLELAGEVVPRAQEGK